MSDIKIQDAPAVPTGAEQALAADEEQKSRSGFVGSQVFRGFPPAPEVQGRAASLCSPAGNNRDVASVSGYACDSPVAPTVKQVDHLAILGSNAPNDYRQKANGAVMPANPGPREAKGQAPLSGRTPGPSAPKSFGSEDGIGA